MTLPAADPSTDSDVARQRREEILTAAEAIIATEGLPRLSLARIERRAGMSRGQLTYYFPTKETILLAVFDRMLARMIADKTAAAERTGAPKPGTAGSAWVCLRHGLAAGLGEPDHPAAANRDLFALVHTFLAQIGHRDDFRSKLAAANGRWRAMLTADFADSGVPVGVRPDLLASMVMALVGGLADQLAVDPGAFDRAAMADACMGLLAPAFDPAVSRNP